MGQPHERGDGLLSLAALAYIGAIGWLYFKQEALLFAPVVLPADHLFTLGDDVKELQVEVAGARLSALHLQNPRPRGVVFFLHGNGGNLDNWFVNIDFYRRANFDLFMIDYRGYGKSSGRIQSQAQLHADVSAAWAGVAPQYAGRKVVIYGRSLGSGLAASLAMDMSTSRAPDLTVLVSSYTSMAALAAEHYRWVPQWLLRYPMRTDRLIGRIGGPVLLIHGDKDPLISPGHSEALKALAPGATLTRISGAAHNDLQAFDTYLDAFASALRAL